MGIGKPKSLRDNDVVLEGLFKSLNINFEQTHLMNAPNVSAAYAAVERFQQIAPQNYNKPAFALAWDWVSMIVHPTWKNAAIQTYQQVLEKTDIEFKKKSAGIPWNLVGLPFKEETYKDEDFINFYQQQWNRNFWQKPCLAHVTVKKEILPRKKIVQNRLRNVVAVDALHNMLMQMTCYDSHHRMQKHNLINMIALGWSPYAGGMQRLAEHLGKHPNGWEIDGGGWESHMFEAVLENIAKLKFESLCDKDRTYDNWLKIKHAYEMIAKIPIVMPDGKAFLKGAYGTGGNLTGQVGTAHDNSLMMLFSVCYCWIMMVNHDIEAFKEHCSIATFGDDLTFTVSDAVVPFFNGPRIAELVWRDFGFIFESPCWDARPFYELGFLSMHFNFNHETQKWVHTINRDKLFSNILQGGTERTPDEQLQRLCGMRNVAWGDIAMRKELQTLIDAYIETQDPTLAGDPLWENAKKSYVSDRLLKKLYFGYESGEGSPHIDFDWFALSH